METRHVVLIFVLVLLVWFYRKYTLRQRLCYIDEYKYHTGLIVKFKKSRSELSAEQVEVISLALKDYFKIAKMAKKKFVAMPSQVVDDLWHEFILFTRQYQHFCKGAFNGYLHHTPAEAMSDKNSASDGIKRTWKYACELEGINPSKPERLPRLFALDSMYNIENGFYYDKDCKNSNGGAYCASDIGCSGGIGCGGDAGSSCGSSCGSGCGGD